MPVTYFMGISDTACAALRDAAVTLGYDFASLTGGVNNAYEQIFLSDFITLNWDAFDWSSIEGVGSRLLPMHFDFLGINLSAQPSGAISGFSMHWEVVGLLLVPVIATLLQYLQTIIISRSNGQSEEQQKSMRMMNLMFPLFSLWVCFSMPAALGVYWIANSVWMMIREAVLGKFYAKKINEEEEEREAKLAAARQMRREEAQKRAAEQRENPPKRPKKLPPKTTPGEKKPPTTEAGRVGERPYARGRSYQADRYEEKE